MRQSAAVGRLPMKISSKKRVWTVDEEDKRRRVLGLRLQTAGYEVSQAGTAEAGLAMLKSSAEERPCMLSITDLRMPGTDAIYFLEQARAANPSARVILLPAFGPIAHATASMKARAWASPFWPVVASITSSVR